MNANWFEWLTDGGENVYCAGDRCLQIKEYCEYNHINVVWTNCIELDKMQENIKKYDVVLLWGVDIREGQLADIETKILTDEGRIILVYDNPLGVSMFNGLIPSGENEFFATFNHENQQLNNTYYRKDEITDILKKNNIIQYKLYYPYPDADYAETIYSDKHMPQKGELHIEEYPFETYRMQLFREQNLYDRIIEAGLFEKFSNSYIVVLGKNLPAADYVKFSNERREELNIYTELISGSHVLKCASGEQSKKHVNRLQNICEDLQKAFAGTPLKADACHKLSDGCVCFDFVNGIRLDAILDEALNKQDMNTFYGMLDRYLDYIRQIYSDNNSQCADIDLIFQNIMIDGDVWNVIDYEWTYDDKRYTAEFLIYRAIHYYYYQSVACRNAFKDIKHLYEYCGIPETDIDRYNELEQEFQKSIAPENIRARYNDDNIIRLSDMMMDVQIECRNKENDSVCCTASYHVPVVNGDVNFETELPCACKNIVLSTPDTMISVGDLNIRGWNEQADSWDNAVSTETVGMKTEDDIYLFPDTPFILTISYSQPVSRIRVSMNIVTKREKPIRIMQKWQGEYLPRMNAAEQKVDELSKLCDERMAVINDYRQQLDSIYNSRGWKMMEKMRKIKGKL